MSGSDDPGGVHDGRPTVTRKYRKHDHAAYQDDGEDELLLALRAVHGEQGRPDLVNTAKPKRAPP